MDQNSAPRLPRGNCRGAFWPPTWLQSATGAPILKSSSRALDWDSVYPWIFAPKWPSRLSAGCHQLDSALQATMLSTGCHHLDSAFQATMLSTACHHLGTTWLIICSTTLFPTDEFEQANTLTAQGTTRSQDLCSNDGLGLSRSSKYRRFSGNQLASPGHRKTRHQ